MNQIHQRPNHQATTPQISKTASPLHAESTNKASSPKEQISSFSSQSNTAEREALLHAPAKERSLQSTAKALRIWLSPHASPAQIETRLEKLTRAMESTLQTVQQRKISPEEVSRLITEASKACNTVQRLVHDLQIPRSSQSQYQLPSPQPSNESPSSNPLSYEIPTHRLDETMPAKDTAKIAETQAPKKEESIWDKIGNFFKQALGFLKQIASFLQPFLDAVLPGLGTAISAGLEMLDGLVKSIEQGNPEAFGKALLSSLSKAIPFVGSHVGKAVEAGGKIIGGITDALGKTTQALQQTEPFKAISSVVQDFFKSPLGDLLKQLFGKPLDQLFSTPLLQGLLQGNEKKANA